MKPTPLTRADSTSTADADIDTDRESEKTDSPLSTVYDATNQSSGFTPRMNPRPSYPPFFSFAFMWLVKALVFEAASLGVFLTVLSYPLYMSCIQTLQSMLQNDALVFSIMLSCAHTGIYILCNVPFFIFDTYGFFQQYKLHRTKGQIPTASLIQSTVLEAAISQFVVDPVLVYFLYPSFQYLGLLALNAPLPTYTDLCLTYCYGFLFNDIGFYLAHRTFHSKTLYWLHKKHHKHAGTMGMSAEYSDPLESVVANIIPSVGGVIFFGCHHPICILVWLSMRLKQTYFAHSGYCFQGTILDYMGLSHKDSVLIIYDTYHMHKILSNNSLSPLGNFS